jgi:hypothetical protein
VDRVVCVPVLDDHVMHQIEPLLLHRRPLNVEKTYISNLVRTTHFWNNIYHVQAQNLKIGKPNNLIVFGNNVFKQKQTSKKLKQRETQKQQTTIIVCFQCGLCCSMSSVRCSVV